MKKFALCLTLVAVFALALFVAPAFALQDEPPPPSVLDVVLDVITQFGTLAGFGALVAALVNILKTFGVVTDGTGGQWFAGFNLVGIAVLLYFRFFQPDIPIDYIDAQAAVFAQILLLVLGYVVQLGSGLFAHNLFSELRLPLVGKSFGLEKASETD